ncbi:MULTISPECIES: polysaccharide biosynthesis/export family protein [Sphingobium]|uniref:polysaccharide biosynthesis/export family protein n=1 Tax=Sphingobium TaxID=165695 RepID=UPI002101AEB0|nr:polysaccharide biosynthesis/export family protein [Sphingobium sp. 15-1]
MMPAVGPSSRTIVRAEGHTVANADIKVIDVTDGVARQMVAGSRAALFSEVLGQGAPDSTVVGRGDILDIVIWEAPPAALFGGTIGGATEVNPANSQVAKSTNMPEQMVGTDGRVTVPFAGSVLAAGRTPQDIARDIVGRLSGKAHDPQVIVRLVRNATREVTVVGDVVTNTRLPLTAKGERVLDALAGAGGAKQPVGKMTIQVSRGTRTTSLALSTIIADPAQNVYLQPGDVVTALYQPFSFTALGAMGGNGEIPFEGNGITLAQALGRVGGLRDDRADVRGVFIFRLETPAALDPAMAAGARMTPDGKVPVIYRIDMKDPATFFIAQSLPIRDKDVLYVSNAPIADLQKFVNILSSLIFPAITIQNANL